MAQQFNYGGQAVLEGVMMRGSRHMAVAVRAPDKTIVLHEEPINSPLYSGVWSRTPFIRGLGLLWDSLGLGTKALSFSAKIMASEAFEDGTPSADANPSSEHPANAVPAGNVVAAAPGGPNIPGADVAMGGTMIISMALGIGLFFVTPLLVADGVRALATGAAAQNSTFGWLTSDLARNLIEGVVRLGLVVGYMWAIGFIPDIKRVFAYHGAEHKTINAYEAGAPLTPEEVMKYPLEHPRCGTGFLLVVMVVSILVFSLLGNPPIILRYLIRIVAIPVIATISYEYIRLTARNMDKAFVRMLVAPQLALQRLTTRQPSLDMLEVSILAFNKVLASEDITVPAAGAAVPSEAK